MRDVTRQHEDREDPSATVIPREVLAKDMAWFVANEDDVRVVRNGYVYYIRPMRRGSSIVGRFDYGGGIEELLLLPLLAPMY